MFILNEFLGVFSSNIIAIIQLISKTLGKVSRTLMHMYVVCQDILLLIYSCAYNKVVWSYQNKVFNIGQGYNITHLQNDEI